MNKVYFSALTIALFILIISSPLVIAPSSNIDYVISAGYTKGSGGCLSVWSANQIGCSGGNSWFCDSEGYWWTKNCGSIGCDPVTGKCMSTEPIAGNDTIKPIIAALFHSYLTTKGPDYVKISATARDLESGLKEIVIFIDNVQMSPCTYAGTVIDYNLCEVEGQFSVGNHTYYAIAKDNSGNQAREPLTGYMQFAITATSSSPTPTPTPGGTCTVDLCGKQAPSGCWCDLACKSYGDCCPGFDYISLCLGAPTPTPTPTPTPNVTTATCSGYCGTKSPSGCWCDSACVKYGDCCPDYQQVCVGGTAPTPTPTPTPTPNVTTATCSGYCGTKSPSGCWCDSACVKYGDCCPDYQQVCK